MSNQPLTVQEELKQALHREVASKDFIELFEASEAQNLHNIKITCSFWTALNCYYVGLDRGKRIERAKHSKPNQFVRDDRITFRAIRKAKQYSLEDVSKATHLSVATIKAIEEDSGQATTTSTPSVFDLGTLSAFYKVDIDLIYCGKTPKNEAQSFQDLLAKERKAHQQELRGLNAKLNRASRSRDIYHQQRDQLEDVVKQLKEEIDQPFESISRGKQFIDINELASELCISSEHLQHAIKSVVKSGGF